MPTVFDAATGEYKYEDPLQPLATANQQFEQDPTADVFEQSEALRTRQASAPLMQPEEKKPFWAKGPGQAIDEVGRQTLNAGGALITDYMDLLSYVGDTAVEAGNMLSGRGFNPDGKFLNDSDNPWTEWRINTFEPQTEAGVYARPVVRTGVALLTLPKTALKGILTPLSWLGKAPVGGKVATGAAKGINNAVDAYKAATAVKSSDDVAKALFSLSGTLPKGKASKFVGNVAKTPWLYATYDDVAKGIVAGKPLTGIKSWMDSVQTSTKALTNFGKLSKQQKIKTIGEALAWDAFVAFNASGEGDALSDETFSDALKGIGIETPFAVSPDDDAVWRKFKQMGEGMLLGGALNAVFDTWRVYRFAENFKAAGPKAKSEILTSFANRSQEIGDGLGQQLLGTVGQGGVRLEDEAFSTWKLQEDVRVRNQIEDFEKARDAKGGEIAPYRPDAPGQLADQTIQPVDVVELNPRVNATVTPQTYRNAFYEALRQAELNPPAAAQLNPAEFNPVEDAIRTMEGLIPDKRTDIAEYLAKHPPIFNTLGLENGIESHIRNAMYTRGLMEGWMEVGPNMSLVIKRNIAADLDVGDLATKQAKALDEASDLEQYQAWLENSAELNPDVQASLQNLERGGAQPVRASEPAPEPFQGVPGDEARYAEWQESNAQLDPRVQQSLGAMEGADPAMANATNNYIEASTEKAAFELGEEVRLQQAQLDAITGQTSDADVVRQMTGQDLNAVDGAYIEKAQQGRGWEVFSADGDLVGRAQTKKAAQKLADQQTAADKKALVNRARQIAADNGGQEIVAEVGPVAARADLKGKVTLTSKQIEELTRYPELQQFWDQLKGGAKKTFEFDMESMDQLSQGFKALLQTAEVKGTPRARVLRNLADKFDTATKLLAPEARAQQFVDGVIDDATQLARKGEICDW